MLTEEEILRLQFHKLGSEILEGRNLKERLKKVMERMRKMLVFSRAALFVINGNNIEIKMAVGRYSFVATSFCWPKETMGCITWVFKNAQSMILHGLNDDQHGKVYYPKTKEEKDILFSVFRMARISDEGDLALAPVMRNGKVIAVLGADKLGKPLNKDDLAHLEDFAEQAAWAIEKAELEKQNENFAKELKALLEVKTQELKKMQEKLVHAERLAAMGELIAGVAHEIKNPLTGIVGFTELLKDVYAKDAEAQQIVRGLSFSVKHLQSVVKNFLSFSNNTKPRKTKMDINKAISDAVLLTDHQFKKMNVTVYMSLAKNAPIIKGDSNQLTQVFTNMFINAAHAMEPNGGPINVESLKDKNNVLVKITDKGIGMTQEVQEKIFQSFFTTKGKGKGTGLGLSISLGIVENHQGKILVDSKPGAGTTFTIILPAA